MKNILKIYVILIFPLLCSCEREVSKNLSGEWYYFDSDSIYNELYFTKELLVYNLEGGSLSAVYFYKIENDSLYISKSLNDVSMEFLFKVPSEKNEEVQLITNKGELIVLYPIEEDLNVWNNINLGVDKNLELIQGWFRRNNLKLYGSENTTAEDSLLIVPPVEEYAGDTIVH